MRPSLLSLLVLLLGCAYVPPVWDAWDKIYQLDFIEPGVTTKDEVLARLGEPDRSYEAEVRYTGHASTGALIFVLPGAPPLVYETEEWWVIIEFDEKNVVSNVKTYTRKPSEHYAMHVIDEDWRLVRPGATRGTIERVLGASVGDRLVDGRRGYEYTYVSAFGNVNLTVIYNREDEAERIYYGQSGLLPDVATDRRVTHLQQWGSLCRHAIAGDGPASSALASHYRHGWRPAKKDFVKAHLWYTRAADLGYFEAIGYRKELEGEMSLAEVSAAEWLFGQWEPQKSECELEADQLVN